MIMHSYCCVVVFGGRTTENRGATPLCDNEHHSPWPLTSAPDDEEHTCSAITEAAMSPLLRAQQCSHRQWSRDLPICSM